MVNLNIKTDLKYDLPISESWPMSGITIPIENIFYNFTASLTSTVAPAVLHVCETALLTLEVKHLNK